jgi:hypothetical protein
MSAAKAYARILYLGGCSPARRELPSELEVGPMPPDKRVDAREYVDILREAVAARNGWKRILQGCAQHHGGRNGEGVRTA